MTSTAAAMRLLGPELSDDAELPNAIEEKLESLLGVLIDVLLFDGDGGGGDSSGGLGGGGGKGGYSGKGVLHACCVRATFATRCCS